eukprot:scaffold33523_cov112-Isochrysis_galbana.AAC.8
MDTACPGVTTRCISRQDAHFNFLVDMLFASPSSLVEQTPGASTSTQIARTRPAPDRDVPSGSQLEALVRGLGARTAGPTRANVWRHRLEQH